MTVATRAGMSLLPVSLYPGTQCVAGQHLMNCVLEQVQMLLAVLPKESLQGCKSGHKAARTKPLKSSGQAWHDIPSYRFQDMAWHGIAFPGGLMTLTHL